MSATATDTAAESPYDIAVEDVGPACKRLTVTIPAEVVNEKIDDQMGTLASEATLPGFRKGKAPRALLERRFGETVRGETRSQVIASAYSAALEEKGIKAVGEPEPVTPFDEIVLEHGRSITFSVDVEVVPQFDVPDCSTFEIKKPILDVTEEHVDAELQRQCTRFGSLVDVTEGAEVGDRLLGPARATKEGDDEPFFTHEDVDVIVPTDEAGGRGQVLGLLIDGLQEMVIGRKTGDELTFETVGPEAHELEHIRGKKLTIAYQVRDVQRIEPASVDDVRAQYGIETEEILREQIRTALEERRDSEQRSVMRDQVCRKLVETVEMDLPEKLSAAQAQRNLERQRIELLQRGRLDDDEIEARLAEARAATEDTTRQRLKLDFILHRLADEFEVSVSEAEINGRIAQMAAQRGVRPEQFRSDLARSGGLGYVHGQLREQKAADRVIDQATVIEVSAEEWRKEQGEGEASGSAPAKKKSTSKKKTSSKKS